MLVHDLIKCGRVEDLAIVDKNRSFTYSDFAQSVKKFRNRLYKLGVREGDRVAIFSRNSAEFVFAYFATASLGAINVPINFQLSNPETAFILKNSESKILLTYTPLELDEFFTEENKIPQYDIATFGDKDFEIDAPELPADFDENSPCVIIYTSGTTGNPKGAVLSHKNLIHNTKQCSVFKCHRECKVLCVLPMYHCFEWTCAVLHSFYCGAEIYIISQFKPKDMIEIVRENQLTDIIAVPSILSLVTALAKPEDFKSVRFAMSGGTTLPEKIITNFKEKFGLPIAEGYGLSETSPAVFLTTHGNERVGSVGNILPEEEVRLVDAEGNDVAVGEPGEVLVRGGNVMLGYWKNPEATKAAFDEDGWFHTGDVAKCDADGFYYIVDRIKEMIISMGENIYPREVEEVIYKFEGIQDAAVVGVEDKLRGQAGACFYVMKEGATMNMHNFKAFLKKNLALYKIPREFHELAEMPRTSTGKISKRTILENFSKIKESKK